MVRAPFPLRSAARELGARLHVELPEHLPQVVFDGARTDEPLGGDLSVGVPLCDEARDLRLLWGELVQGCRGAFRSVVACRPTVVASPFGERLHAGGGEEVVCAPQLFARVEPTPLA